MSQPKREKPPPREGFRKSARHAEGRKRYEEVDTDDSEGGDAWAPSSSREGSDEEGGSSKSRRVRRRRDAQSRGSIMHTNALSYTDVLKRLKNPTAPGGDPVGNGDPNAESDEEGNDFPRQPLPSREPPRDGKQGKGTLIFENANRHFRPNVTPEEMLRGGVFGGTAFRPYRSAVLHRKLESTDDLSEFPESWYTELDASHELTSPDYDPSVNRYGVKAGQTLEEWENNGWIKRQDPRGWWQWYFRFYQGRRSKDDARQIGRWQKACGPAGRFKRSLVSKIVRSHATWDDESVSPVGKLYLRVRLLDFFSFHITVRQTLFHWAYELTESDYEDYLPDAS